MEITKRPPPLEYHPDCRWLEVCKKHQCWKCLAYKALKPTPGEILGTTS